MKLSVLAWIFFCAYTFAIGQAGLDRNASALSDSAVKLWRQNKYDEALKVLNQSLEIARKNNDSLQIAKGLNNTGLIYISKGDPVKSIFYYEQSLKILRELNNDKEFSTSLLNLGIAYKEQGIYDKSLKYLFEAVDYFESHRDAKKQSSAYNAIGNIFRVEKNYQEALKYHRNALKLRIAINYDEGIAASLNSIGVVFKETELYDSALKYLEGSLQKAKYSSPPSEHYANTLSHLADVYEKTSHYTLAAKYYDSAYNIRKSIDSKKGIAYSMFELGSLNFNVGKYVTAENYLLQSILTAKNIEASDVLVKCYSVLRKLYRTKKNYSKAIEYDDLYITLSEKILGEEKLKSLTQMQVKYETEKKQEEIDNLNHEKEKREAMLYAQELQLRAKNANNRVLLTIVIFLIAVLILIVILFRLKNRFAKKLDTVMREVHHRVKNNFQVLLSLFDLQLPHISDDEAKEIIKGNANRISSMMLIHKDLYPNKEITTVKMTGLIQSIVENLLTTYELRERGIKIEYDIDEAIKLSFDNAISVGLLVNELVTNSFKYAFGLENTHPALTIRFNKKANHVLVIKDNYPKSASIIFKKSFGLKLVKTQVNLLRGDIETITENGVEHKITF